jgi:ankyrin repeat protein
MIQPDELKQDEPLLWSAGTGTEVWRMFCAAISGDLPTIQALVEKNPAIAQCHYHYRTPLYFAVRENQLEVARYLLARSDPLRMAYNDSFLEVARDRGYAEMEKLLEEHLARNQNASARGEPVAAAIRARDLPKVRQFLDASPELLHAGDERSCQPIHWAVMTRQIDVIDEVLHRGADIDAVRCDGARPIHLTNGDYFYRGWRDVPKDTAATPQDVLAHLISRGAYVDIWTAAHLGNLNRVKELLDEDPSLANKISENYGYYLGSGDALRNAAANGHMDVVKLLLARGADPNLRQENFAPHGHALYSAVYNRHYEIAKLLLEHGAYPNPEVESSADALSIAIMNSDTKMIDLLVSHGAVWNIPVELAPQPAPT